MVFKLLISFSYFSAFASSLVVFHTHLKYQFWLLTALLVPFPPTLSILSARFVDASLLPFLLIGILYSFLFQVTDFHNDFLYSIFAWLILPVIHLWCQLSRYFNNCWKSLPPAAEHQPNFTFVVSTTALKYYCHSYRASVALWYWFFAQMETPSYYVKSLFIIKSLLGQQSWFAISVTIKQQCLCNSPVFFPNAGKAQLNVMSSTPAIAIAGAHDASSCFTILLAWWCCCFAVGYQCSEM